MGPKTSELCATLRDTSYLLKQSGENYWSDWLDKSLSRIENQDLSGVDLILQAFGGMGSFNDLTLSSANGHSVTDTESDDANHRLDMNRTRLYSLAREVRRIAVTEE